MRRAPFHAFALLLILATDSLSQAPDEGALGSALVQADASWDERRAAARALAGMGERGLPALLAALADPSREVSAAARVGLLAAGDAALPLLVAKLQDGTRVEKLAAARALGDFGARAEPGFPALDAGLSAGDPVLAHACRRSLVLAGRALGVALEELVRTNGAVLRGAVVEEDDEEVSFAALRRGESGTTVLVTTVPRKEIARVTRSPDIHRPILHARIEAFRERQKGEAESRNALEVRTEGPETDRVYSVETEHFFVKASAPEDFVRRAAMRLEAMALAYEDVFSTPIEPAAPATVIIASTLAEYEAIQEDLFHHVLQNPAFYRRDLDMILGYSDLHEWQADVAEARAIYQKLEKDIDGVEAELRKARRELTVDLREAREKVAALAVEYKRANNRDLSGTARIEENKRVDVWAAEEYESLDLLGDQIKEKIKTYEMSLRETQARIDARQRENQELLDSVTREMFDTLAHEAFHAFFEHRIRLPEHEGVMARWLEEGLAMYFESAAFDGVELYPGESSPEWLQFLQEKNRSRSLVALDRLLAGGADDFLIHTEEETDRSNTFYYGSWYLVRLLAEEGRMNDPGALRRYLSDTLAGTAPAEAFERLAGSSLADVEKTYRAHLAADDGARYEWIRFAPGTGPGGAARVLGRVQMRLKGEAHIRLRTGDVVVVPEGAIEQDVARR